MRSRKTSPTPLASSLGIDAAMLWAPLNCCSRISFGSGGAGVVAEATDPPSHKPAASARRARAAGRDDPDFGREGRAIEGEDCVIFIVIVVEVRRRSVSGGERVRELIGPSYASGKCRARVAHAVVTGGDHAGGSATRGPFPGCVSPGVPRGRRRGGAIPGLARLTRIIRTMIRTPAAAGRFPGRFPAGFEKPPPRLPKRCGKSAAASTAFWEACSTGSRGAVARDSPGKFPVSARISRGFPADPLYRTTGVRADGPPALPSIDVESASAVAAEAAGPPAGRPPPARLPRPWGPPKMQQTRHATDL